MNAPIEQPHPGVVAFFQAGQNLFFNLRDRWQDEQEYEDINDYKVPVDKLAATHNVVIEKMTKRPFGCIFRDADGNRFQIRVTARTYQLEQAR